MVGLGYPNKTIAANLGISSWTVSTHLRRMFAKFGVSSRAALVASVLEERRCLRRTPGPQALTSALTHLDLADVRRRDDRDRDVAELLRFAGDMGRRGV